MKRMISQGLVVLVLVANPLVSLAQKTDGDIKNMLQKRDTEIKELLGPEGNEYTNEQREELKNIINGVIDFEAMSREALEETFDTINTEQRTEFIDLFSTIVRDQSLNKLDIYRAKVTYETITVNG
ncbi:MAG: ABC transporter substrate-binding protein, partial [Bacteroidota bacterium]